MDLQEILEQLNENEITISNILFFSLTNYGYIYDTDKNIDFDEFYGENPRCYYRKTGYGLDLYIFRENNHYFIDPKDYDYDDRLVFDTFDFLDFEDEEFIYNNYHKIDYENFDIDDFIELKCLSYWDDYMDEDFSDFPF